jgi:hypothetical protein
MPATAAWWVTATGDEVAVWNAATLSREYVLWNQGRSYVLVFGTLGIAVCLVAWSILHRRKRCSTCSMCGQTFPVATKSPPPVCPTCQQQMQPYSSTRRGLVKALAWLVLLCMMMALLPGRWFSTGVGIPYWLAVILAGLGGPIVLIGSLLGIFYARSRLALRRLRDEDADFDTARKSAACEGSILRLGGVTAWLADGAALGAELPDVLQRSRARFQSLIGSCGGHTPCAVGSQGEDSGDRADGTGRMPAAAMQSPVFDGRLRIVVFRHVEPYRDYLRRHGLQAGAFHAVYLHQPLCKIILAEDGVRRQLYEPAELLASTVGFYLCEHLPAAGNQAEAERSATKRGSTRRTSSLVYTKHAWLSTGLSQVLAHGDDRAEAESLNRALLASLAAGRALGRELFDVSLNQRFQRAMRQFNHGDFAFTAQFGWQSWSVVRFLTCASAGHGPAFQQFVHRLNAGIRADEACAGAFGAGFEELLRQWRHWVEAQGAGSPKPINDRCRETLTAELIPCARDPQQPLAERIRAVRSMGQAGYLLGADALMELLRVDVPLALRTEARWALQSISGLALPADPDAWQAWWAESARFVTPGVVWLQGRGGGPE